MTMRTLWGFAVLLAIVSGGCTAGQMRSRLSASSIAEPVRFCTTSSQLQNALTSPFQVNSSKIIENDFYSLERSAAYGTFETAVDKKAQTTSTFIMNAGFEVVLLVNRQCLDEVDSPLAKQLKPLVRPYSRSDKSSIEQSITYRLPGRTSLDDLRNILELEPCVVGASPERKLQALSLPNDPRYAEQNSLTSIKHSAAWSKISGLNEDIVVAVVDSGTDLTHPDLLATTWVNSDEIPGNNIDDDSNGYIDDIHGYNNCYGSGNVQGNWHIEHGEHIHGIIAAASNNSEGIVGVASPTVKVMHMTIFGQQIGLYMCRETSGESTRLEEGIRYAADNGAKSINLSWGARGYSSTTLAAIQYAISKGAVVVAAAANSNEEITDANPWYPAVYAKDLEGLISVAATDANPASGYGKCGFSNVSNSYVEIAAPGCDTTVTNSTYGSSGLLSTLRMSTHQGYGYMAGTSMATPHVAAAAGLIFAQRKSLGLQPTPQQVEILLMAGSRNQSNLDAYVVNGRHLDLDLLMTSLVGDTGPVDPPPCD